MQHQNSSQQLDDLAQQANQLAQQEADTQNRLRKMIGASGSDNPRFGSQGLQNQQEAERLAGEKNAMADKLKKLEQGMSDTARSMAGAQNPAGNKLREALGEAQQNELEMHMRQNAQFIRQGYGSPGVGARKQRRSRAEQSARSAAAGAGRQSAGPANRGKVPAATIAILKKRWLAWRPCEAGCSSWPKSQQGKGNQPGQGRRIQSAAARQPGRVNKRVNSLADNRDRTDNQASKGSQASRDNKGRAAKAANKVKAASPRRTGTARLAEMRPAMHPSAAVAR